MPPSTRSRSSASPRTTQAMEQRITRSRSRTLIQSPASPPKRQKTMPMPTATEDLAESSSSSSVLSDDAALSGDSSSDTPPSDRERSRGTRTSPRGLASTAVASPSKHGSPSTRAPRLKARLSASEKEMSEIEAQLEQSDSGVGLEDIHMAQRAIWSRISETHTPSKLVDLEDQSRKLHDFLEKTIRYGESNSILLVGDRGSGKSMTLRKALEAFRDNADSSSKSFMEIHLNGLIHTEDKIALKDIVRQMNLEQQIYDRKIGSFAECLSTVLTALRPQSKSSSIPVVIIIEEFDLFASRNQKQSLLYNLFDIVQNSAGSVAVVGVTCRVDAIEMLEKRVKSRFSHQQIRFYSPIKYEGFVSIMQNCLTLRQEDIHSAEYLDSFNSYVQALFSNTQFTRLLKSVFEFTRNPRLLNLICMTPVLHLSKATPYLSHGDFIESVRAQLADQPKQLMKGLSTLDLCLLVAISKLVYREVTKFNFEMVYDEFKAYIYRNRSQAGASKLLFRKPVALKSFENLQSIELIKPTQSLGQCPKEFRLMALALDPSQIEDAVDELGDSVLKHWVNAG
ncbi:origin recognition complex subunit 4 C-terminus-domain-containing protein [Polychytrium aggregatum]|uniref:origin recognition complex subunit 4 C-terminus-domain-containing protein n=1 Tax=Polychytrium aggregatum TaxID=110093 RepID=UPI0022FF2DDF|nr:origin recognition complex subunit 4 C-terminus-domain-containing protein [Polychytrium aggregatum]KAI9207942.1 origin recognition complex subunit 4 C-terminus-domain-containing protein [Polychytrium aggregatum]